MAKSFRQERSLYERFDANNRQGYQVGWRRHIVPFVLTTVLFGAVHLLAGFQAMGSIVLIFLLSAYLTALRAVTGSVKTSIVAHLVWNLTAAVGLAISSFYGLT